MTQLAIDRELTLIAFEAMNHWTVDGAVGLHVFHKNNELAGYCSVLQALQLTGITGDYGRRLSAVVIGFGATARGAVTALNAHGVHDVAVLTNRGVAAVGSPIHSVRIRQFDHDPEPPHRSHVITDRGRVPAARRYLAENDIVVNCTLQDTAAPLIYLDVADLAAFRRGSLIVDVSCDEGMGFEWARPTTFDEPMFTVGDNVDYYAVDHSPSYLWNSATWENSEALLPFLPVGDGRPGGVGRRRDDQRGRSRSARAGSSNPAILRVPGAGGAAPAPGRLTGPYQASASSSRVSASSCGRVLVPPTTVMKLASPDQRGTTCWCRWSASEPPATPAEVQPHVERVRAADLLEHPDRVLGHLHQLGRLVAGRAPRARPRGASGSTIRCPGL